MTRNFRRRQNRTRMSLSLQCSTFWQRERAAIICSETPRLPLFPSEKGRNFWLRTTVATSIIKNQTKMKKSIASAKWLKAKKTKTITTWYRTVWYPLSTAFFSKSRLRFIKRQMLSINYVALSSRPLFKHIAP